MKMNQITAAGQIKDLIAAEAAIRGTGLDGHMPVTPATRMADSIRDYRRVLQAVVAHVAGVSDEARADMAAGRWDSVMTDALYAFCGARTPEEMSDARSTATAVAAQ